MTYVFPRAHLIDTDELSVNDINAIFDLAASYVKQNKRRDKKIDKFRGRTCVNLFFENSTRTRTSFEIAAKRLGADVVNVPVAQSSTQKGETWLDTALNLDAMQLDALVVRHATEGIPRRIADRLNAHVINAGDGKHAHPTQALLDAMAIKKRKGRLDGLTVAICGDLARSRVARSNIHLLKKFGATIRVIAPHYFVSDDYAGMGVELADNLEFGLRDADVVIMLRIQHERENLGIDFAAREKEYIAAYGLTRAKMKAAKPDAIILHPGPINRGVELVDDIADDPEHSVILEQVELGVAVRMAVFDLLLSQ